jgi:parallel beta-helix repeat protein
MNKRYGMLVVSVTILVLSLVGTASATNWTVDGSGGADFTGIQDAINNASVGDTIIVKDGHYSENINVSKSLMIRSKNGAGSTIIRTEDPYSVVFDVTADYVTISGFTVKGASTGIFLYHADYCSISNNNCSNNSGDGIQLLDSNNNIISGNNCSNNSGDGIQLLDSNNNIISGNNCSNNYWDAGISLSDSNGNIISNNNCSNNWDGIWLFFSNSNQLTGNAMLENGIVIWGHTTSDYMQDIDESNIVNEKSVYYWKDKEGGRIPDGAGQIILVNCKNVAIENQNLNNASGGIQIAFSSYITIKNNNCSNNGHGIHLLDSSNNIMSENNCSNNGFGIRLRDSNNNCVSNNTCSNDVYGSYLENSNSNVIYLNNFTNNTDDVYSHRSTNTWNSKEKITYTYHETTYESYLGNYWDDYEGTDAEGDGIGDISYSLNSDNSDDYPLTQPFENYIIPSSAHT